MNTNADVIRSMTDDELAEFLEEFEIGYIDYSETFCNLCQKDATLERKSRDCTDCLKWWLKNDCQMPQGLKHNR